MSKLLTIDCLVDIEHVTNEKKNECVYDYTNTTI